jgi:hypothetical protein
MEPERFAIRPKRPLWCLTFLHEFGLMNESEPFLELGAKTMYRRNTYRLIVLGVALAAVLALPAESFAACRVWDCLFGSGPAPQTTYAPPYVPPVAAQPCAAPCQPCAAPCQSCAPCVTYQSCQPCATVVPACGSCVTQTCNMPGVVYRTLYPPVAMAAYRPAAACNTCVGYTPVTTYRPFFGTYETRLVPYTTNLPVYTPVATYAYSPCTSCAAYATYAPCSSCSPCGGGGCGVVSYEAPAAGCSSCAASAAAVPAVENAAPNPAPPRTFEEKANKPAIDQDLKPTPQPEVRPSSNPAPIIPDPNSRRAERPISTAARVSLVARPVEEPPLRDNDGWRPVKE